MYYLYFILILLTNYLDSPLALYTGDFGMSVLPLISILMFPYFVLSKKIKYIDRFIKKFWKLIKYTLFITLISFLVLPICGISLFQLGEFLPIKAIKVATITTGYLCYLIIISNICIKLSVKQIFKPFYYGFIFITILTFIEYQQIPFAFQQLHFSGLFPYYRIRLLTSESSATAPLIEIFFIFALYYSHYILKNKLKTFLIIGCFLLQLLLSGSKTLLVAFTVGIIIANWEFIKSFFLRFSIKKFGILLFIIIGIHYCYLIFITPMIQSFTRDIEEFTSVATRAYSVSIGYGIGTVFPCGIGFSSHLYLLPYAMEKYISLIPSILNTDEIISYLTNGDDTALTAKSMFGQYSMYWGIFGSIYFLRQLLSLYKSAITHNSLQGKILFKVLLIINIIQLLFTADMQYIVLSVIAVLISLKYHKTVSPNYIQ